MTTPLQWAVLGAGRIAGSFAKGLAHSKTGKLVGVGSRSREGAEKFGQEYHIPEAGRHASYEALLADPNVQAVYIATPHPMHAEWAIKTAEAGKHVLCEKPIGMNHAEAMAMFAAAQRHNVFMMEAFMYRCHPQTHKVVELIRSGAIGQVKFISATFGFQAGFNPDSRIFNNALGGGGILDVGCYAVSMARLVAGVAQGKDFADPIAVTGTGHLGSTGIDEYAIGTLKFAGNIVAQIATAVALSLDNTVRIIGTDGNIFVPWPWIPAREGGSTTITLNKNGQKPEEITIQTDQWLYGIEADAFAEGVRTGKAPHPAMSAQDTLGNMRTLDQWRHAIGLTYDAEKPTANIPTITHRPLHFAAISSMPHGRIPHLEKPVSRLIFGCDNQMTLPFGSVVWDDFFERGGNAFDTAHIYGGGLQERLLGQWIKNRNIRDQVVVITKGAHTPFCTPLDLLRQFNESLERAQFDAADLYIMHRDNTDIPVGEFVDVLNQLKSQGKVQAFGGSNWSLRRVEEANDYARNKGLQGFSLVNNNFSLAHMVDPVWGGCIHNSDAASRAWLTQHQLPLLAWSSQARGFFTDRAAPDKRDDAELVRCWYSPENFQRRQHAIELAKKKNCSAINIALAYVLHQPFPTFALIGPRTLEETRSSLEGLKVTLSPEELRWLSMDA